MEVAVAAPAAGSGDQRLATRRDTTTAVTTAVFPTDAGWATHRAAPGRGALARGPPIRESWPVRTHRDAAGQPSHGGARSITPGPSRTGGGGPPVAAPPRRRQHRRRRRRPRAAGDPGHGTGSRWREGTTRTTNSPNATVYYGPARRPEPTWRSTRGPPSIGAGPGLRPASQAAKRYGRGRRGRGRARGHRPCDPYADFAGQPWDGIEHAHRRARRSPAAPRRVKPGVVWVGTPSADANAARAPRSVTPSIRPVHRPGAGPRPTRGPRSSPARRTGTRPDHRTRSAHRGGARPPTTGSSARRACCSGLSPGCGSTWPATPATPRHREAVATVATGSRPSACRHCATAAAAPEPGPCKDGRHGRRGPPGTQLSSCQPMMWSSSAPVRRARRPGCCWAPDRSSSCRPLALADTYHAGSPECHRPAEVSSQPLAIGASPARDHLQRRRVIARR